MIKPSALTICSEATIAALFCTRDDQSEDVTYLQPFFSCCVVFQAPRCVERVSRDRPGRREEREKERETVIIWRQYTIMIFLKYWNNISGPVCV